VKFADLETQDKPKQKETKPVIVDEPGNKIPIGSYHIIGQWCDNCEDVEMHVHNKKLKKIRCVNCKTTKQLK
jgi:hypothetical protein